jgi:predicted permease
LAQIGTRIFTIATADILYLTLDLQPDSRVLVFTAAVSLVTTVLFGTLPALYAARMPPSQVRNPAARFRQRTSRILVGAQVALSLLLLLDAGLLIRSLWNLHSAELGFDRLHVSTFELAREPGLAAAEFADFEHEIAERIRSLSQVQGVAFSSYGLFARGGLTAPARVRSGGAERQLNVGYISPEFFATFGMSIALGRDLLPEDSRAATTPAILSEAAARHFFGDRYPMGESIYLPGLDERNRYIPFSQGLTEARRFEIVGVVRDAFERGPREAPAYRLYLPIGPERFAETFYVRFASDGEQAIPIVLQAMRDYASKVRVADVTTLEQQLSQNYALETLGSRLLTFFGLLGLVLAAVGLYGVMSYSVNRRTPEIGVRIALGAHPRGILIMVLRESAILVLIGIGLGIPLALVAARVLQTRLFGVTPYDPFTIATVISLLFFTGVVAGFVPARRASNVDAMVALRRE